MCELRRFPVTHAYMLRNVTGTSEGGTFHGDAARSALMPSAEGATAGRGVTPSVLRTSPPNTTVVLSDLGENMELRFFMKTESASKILISKATVPPQFRRALRRNWGG
jgi:hypothetical protein